MPGHRPPVHWGGCRNLLIAVWRRAVRRARWHRDGWAARGHHHPRDRLPFRNPRLGGSGEPDMLALDKLAAGPISQHGAVSRKDAFSTCQRAQHL